MAKFELVSKYAGATELLPIRGTANSAGYDFIVAEDMVIPPYENLSLRVVLNTPDVSDLMGTLTNMLFQNDEQSILEYKEMSLKEVADLTAADKQVLRPTLVSTGVKCKLAADEYLELVPRSSTPLKHWLIVANSPGVIDSDYYNNPDNEGEIFVQLINLFPRPIKLSKGDKIAQGIIKKYYTTEDDTAGGMRVGGFGSTS